MIAQYLAACLVSDCKTLAHPDSVDSIPTSANQEDHVSMSMNAALHARKVVESIEYVVAIELLCATIGVQYRLQDLKKKTCSEGYKQGDKRPEPKPEEERTRVDERVRFLHKHGLEPTLGRGSQVAYELILKKLKGLPELGKQPMVKDRYLRPYVLRIYELLRSRELVTEVYKQCGITIAQQSKVI